MKKIITFLLVLISLLATGQSNVSKSQNIADEIDKLLTHQYYFAARDLYNSQYKQLSQFQQLKAGAVLDNVFNHPDASNLKIEQLFKNYNELLADSVKYSLLETKQNNHSKLYEYKQAYATIDEILKKYSRLYKKSDIDDYKNTQKIWKVLSDQPKQQVLILGNTDMKIIKDEAGLSNLEVTKDTVSIPFIFDTGANFSTVTESTARKLGMTVFDSLIDVTSITGNKIKAHMAICPVFKLGNIQVNNAVCIVFPDKELAIPQIDYQINGILGFPVIEAMKEVQITKGGDFIVPKTRTTNPEQNMAIHNFVPVINIEGETYSFDSGADQTMLYNVYYKRHKAEIAAKYREEKLSFGGAGGLTTKRGFMIKFEPLISGKKIKLNSVMVFLENIKEEENYLSGNIGQDIIRKFEKMTLNFEDMFIRFD